MSSELIFDALQYANKLKGAGVPEKQAEVHAEAMAEIVDSRLATKKDLKELGLVIGQKIKELELRMTIKLGGIMLAGLSMLVVLMKLCKL